MRGDHDVVELEQGIVRGRGFLLEHIYAGAGESKRRLEAEYAELRPLLTELGMAKQQ